MIWIIIVLLIMNLVLLIKLNNMKRKQKNIKNKMHNLLFAQSQHGAFDYNEYELGMWQGMENMLAKFEDRKPVYQDIKGVDFMDSFKNR